MRIRSWRETTIKEQDSKREKMATNSTFKFLKIVTRGKKNEREFKISTREETITYSYTFDRFPRIRMSIRVC